MRTHAHFHMPMIHMPHWHLPRVHWPAIHVRPVGGIKVRLPHIHWNYEDQVLPGDPRARELQNASTRATGNSRSPLKLALGWFGIPTILLVLMAWYTKG